SVTLSGSLSASLSGISGRLGTTVDMGVAGEIGLGPFVRIDLLGNQLCNRGWPFWDGAFDLGVTMGVSAGLSIDTSGVDAWFDVQRPTQRDFPFAALQDAWDSTRLRDDCPLCRTLYAAGLMPSQMGGTWTGHPAPPWPGPLRNVYPRDPRIPSGAKCRGACGPD